MSLSYLAKGEREIEEKKREREREERVSDRGKGERAWKEYKREKERDLHFNIAKNYCEINRALHYKYNSIGVI